MEMRWWWGEGEMLNGELARAVSFMARQRGLWQASGGFSIDASVHIAARDRAWLERLLGRPVKSIGRRMGDCPRWTVEQARMIAGDLH